MSHRDLPKDSDPKISATTRRKLSLWRRSVYAGLCLGGLLIFVAVLVLVFREAMLNRYGKNIAEQVFARAHPGYTLQIGELTHAIESNRLVTQSVTVTGSKVTFKVGPVSLTGLRWSSLLWGTPEFADVLAQASLEATNLTWELPQSQYGVVCARLSASVADSELIAGGIELQPLVADEAFFAAREFRKTRLRVVAPDCEVSGLACIEALEGKAYRVRSIRFSGPTVNVLINRDKPERPFVKSPLMIHELLAALRQPLQVDDLSVTNGVFEYCERRSVGAAAGVLTFGDVDLSVVGVANSDEAAAIQLQARASFMNEGELTVRMSVPIATPDFSFQYSGSLGAMDLTRLNAFLEIAERTRIKSGTARNATFEIKVTDGQALGTVRAIYQDLVVAVLDDETGNEKGFENRVTSLLANVLKIRNSNPSAAPSSMKEGAVNYTRQPGDAFQEYIWNALRTGVMDVIVD